MKRLLTLGLAAALSVSTFATFAAEPAPPTPEQAAKNGIEARQGLFKVLSTAMGPIGGMMRNRVPFDAAVVEKNATRIEVLAGMIPEMFQNDTRKFHTNVKTAALDGIWSSQADFKTKADDLAKAAHNLATVAKGGDKAKTLEAAGAVGKACGNCHDQFRAKQQ